MDYSISYTLGSVGASLLTAFKEHIRVDHTAEDTSLTRYLDTAATEWQEGTRRLLVRATVSEFWDRWPWDVYSEVRLHRAPLVSVDGIYYFDSDNVLQTWASSNYEVEAVTPGGAIAVAYAATVTSPALYSRLRPCYAIYTAGYVTDAASIPADIQNALFVRAAWLYDRGRDGAPEVDAAAVERCWQASLAMYTWSL